MLKRELAILEFANREKVTLEQIKKDKALHAIALIKQSRLSVMPLTDKEYARILELGGAAK
jgi:predicted RNA-binding protein with PUA-like domain